MFIILKCVKLHTYLCVPMFCHFIPYISISSNLPFINVYIYGLKNSSHWHCVYIIIIYTYIYSQNQSIPFVLFPTSCFFPQTYMYIYVFVSIPICYYSININEYESKITISGCIFWAIKSRFSSRCNWSDAWF